MTAPILNSPAPPPLPMPVVAWDYPQAPEIPAWTEDAVANDLGDRKVSVISAKAEEPTPTITPSEGAVERESSSTSSSSSSDSSESSSSSFSSISSSSSVSSSVASAAPEQPQGIEFSVAEVPVAETVVEESAVPEPMPVDINNFNRADIENSLPAVFRKPRRNCCTRDCIVISALAVVIILSVCLIVGGATLWAFKGKKYIGASITMFLVAGAVCVGGVKGIIR